ncbi:solute carrier family 12 member 5-like [Physella acuta]|uniref:solute carrier family 12 member 5-like n=1 Tax=Physella acuta TaxID=109671 RepID=UPI0027DDABF2|nr:solute carrier family 12 member 5-like [Physella acuta]XP_059164425.1 solute carrier family 12 member 5-like [Physella acuta]XP_059164426.1 solute carrier family 12 member 5-like [Physella acuta]XP_059164427.1 solute carrier family 12 member 5-like [Physella acuta]XP_059164428.1 solute carrier family 12 member 5-like [Physella acuta]XP_059164429.1 solute carrier family 12 member 5-like [Physella acuta]XP_059164430.1 solute carrier family 12 member 5-like [Physella acuta]XP_059164431.1 sol
MEIHSASEASGSTPVSDTNPGRFKVYPVNEYSVFDAPVQASNETKVTFDDFKKNYEHALDKRTLTLYEDDIGGNVDSIQRVVKKTVDSTIAADENEPPTHKANLGTFLGVFLPCCQNIVGVIYFVRFPWIVGCAGIFEGGIIVMICCGMSICTAISMSAIATNGRVTAGGTYFMISRSLGPTFGGSVGILFFLGTSISVAMYYLGTIETLLTYIAPSMAIFGDAPEDPARLNDYRLYCSILLLIMTTVVFIGVKCVSRFAFFAILFLVAGLLSIFCGLAAASPERSVKLCVLGNRAIKYSAVFKNNSWECNKDPGGPLYKLYCPEGNMCDEFFLQNEARLIPGIPGFSLRLVKDAWDNFYTEKGNIPGTNVKAQSARKDITTDITTSFIVLIGIYFPSITGVESGSNYSGDLKDAQVSIPRGTISAAIVTSLIYFSSVFFFGGSVEGVLLRDKFGRSISNNGDLVLSLIAYPSKWVVLVGTFTATIGAGMQALAGGPRLLQAIAEDNIIPGLAFFSKKWHGEPVRCLVVTFIIAEIGLLIAFLDYVAPIVTMFFLMCYGFINFAVTLQSLLDTPHWRPSFKYYHWSLTLLGTCLCLVTMFICSWQYAIVAIFLAYLMYNYLEYKGAEKEWGDGMTGLKMTSALYALMRMKHDYMHIKNWRPQVLVLLKLKNITMSQTEFNNEDMALVQVADMLKAGKGLTMFGTVIQGTIGVMKEEKQQLKQIFIKCVKSADVKGFIEIVVSPSITDGLCCMIQSAGLGALRPNTIVMGWPSDWIATRCLPSYHTFLDTIYNVGVAGNALIVCKNCEGLPVKGERLSGTIDIWWIVNDGGMLLLLGHLLTRHKMMSKCKIRLFTVAGTDENSVQIKNDLKTYLYQLRINGTVEVIEMADTDISAYVYERTLKLEERSKMLAFLSTTYKKKSTGTSHRRASWIEKDAQCALDLARNGTLDENSSPTDFFTRRTSLLPSVETILHMNTAIRLNEAIKLKSASASIIILNLPSVPHTAKGQANYMSFLEELTDGLSRMLLVRGTGKEVITVFN